MASDLHHYLRPLDEEEYSRLFDRWIALHPGCLILALVPEAERAKVPALQAACRARGLTLAGGLFPALIRDGAFAPDGAWLCALPPGTEVRLVPQLEHDPKAAAARLAETVRPALGGAPAAALGEAPRTLFTLFDGALPNVASIVDALYLELADAVRYVGACAGSETFRPTPCLFDGDQLVEGGALAIVLPGAAPSVLVSDYHAPREPNVATATAGNQITSIDFRPAFEFYRTLVFERHGIQLDREHFYRYAAEHPFAIVQANGQLSVRMPVAVEDDGSIRCVGELPPFAMLVVAEPADLTSGSTARALAARLTEEAMPSWMLMFYCAGRRLRFGEGSTADLRLLLDTAGALETTAGALSLGEIGSTLAGGYPSFHNGAVVCLGWPR